MHLSLGDEAFCAEGIYINVIVYSVSRHAEQRSIALAPSAPVHRAGHDTGARGEARRYGHGVDESRRRAYAHGVTHAVAEGDAHIHAELGVETLVQAPRRQVAGLRHPEPRQQFHRPKPRSVNGRGLHVALLRRASGLSHRAQMRHFLSHRSPRDEEQDEDNK